MYYVFITVTESLSYQTTFDREETYQMICLPDS
jgi:hypothetical protein